MARINKVIVVDANAIFREGLVKVLAQTLRIECLGFEALESLNRANVSCGEEALFVVDWGDSEAAIASGIGRLLETFPNSFVVVLTERYSDAQMLCALRAGARGYVLKQNNSEVIVGSLQLICLGEHVFPVKFVEWIGQTGGHLESEKTDQHEIFDVLSPREIEVFAVLCEGKSNKVIARRCGITEATVKVHVKAILRKLKARNRTEAAVWARDHMFPANGHPFGI